MSDRLQDVRQRPAAVGLMMICVVGATPGCGSDSQPSGVVGPGQLALSLDSALDRDEGEVKAAALNRAKLLDESGRRVASAVVHGESAIFDVSSLASKSYFIAVNDDADDLIPTRIEEQSAGVLQRVGRKLRSTMIGTPEHPSYRMNTYPDDPVVQFSDEIAIADEHAYVLLDLVHAETELRVLGTAAKLTSLALGKCAGHSYVPADAWLLNTRGEDHHGDLYDSDGGATTCGGCHAGDATKPSAPKDIDPSHGWCFRCHDGPVGPKAGFVDPQR